MNKNKSSITFIAHFVPLLIVAFFAIMGEQLITLAILAAIFIYINFPEFLKSKTFTEKSFYGLSSIFWVFMFLFMLTKLFIFQILVFVVLGGLTISYIALKRSDNKS